VSGQRQAEITSIRLPESDVTQPQPKSTKKPPSDLASTRAGTGSSSFLREGSIRGTRSSKKSSCLLWITRHGGLSGPTRRDWTDGYGIEPVPCALARGLERVLRREEDRTGSLIFLDVGIAPARSCAAGRRGLLCQGDPVGVERFTLEGAAKLALRDPRPRPCSGRARP